MPLNTLMAELVRRAEARPGQVYRSGALAHGLHVAVKVDIENMHTTLQLQLSREKTYPSDRELKTVVGNLPEGFQQVGEARKFSASQENKPAFFLRASLRRSESGTA